MSEAPAIYTTTKSGWLYKPLTAAVLVLLLMHLIEIFEPFSINLVGVPAEVAKTGYCGWAYIFNSLSLTLLTLFLVLWVPYECLRVRTTYKNDLKMIYLFSIILFLGWLFSYIHFDWFAWVAYHFYLMNKASTLEHWIDLIYNSRVVNISYYSPEIYALKKYGYIVFKAENSVFTILLVAMCFLWRKIIKPWKALLIFFAIYFTYFVLRSFALFYMIFKVKECQCFQGFVRYLIYLYIDPALRTTIWCSV